MPRQRRPLKTPTTYKPDSTLNKASSAGKKGNTHNKRSKAYTNKTAHKSSKQNNTQKSSVVKASTLRNVFDVVFNIVVSIPAFFIALYKKSRKLGIAVTVLLLIAILIMFDAAVNSNKIYGGISIGDVDVSNLTVKEAQDKVSDYYNKKIQDKSIYIFSDEIAYDSINIDDYFQQRDALAEQISAEEDARNTKIVTTNSSELGAFVDSNLLANSAFEVGKHFNYFERLGAKLFGKHFDVALSFGDGFDGLVNNLNSFAGSVHVDYNVEFNGSSFSVTSGHDGNAINADSLSNTLQASFFNDDAEVSKILVSPEYDPIIIDESVAGQVCDKLNAFCSNGASFSFDSNYKEISNVVLSGWIKTKVDDRQLTPYFDYQLFLKDIKSKFESNASLDGISITNNNNELMVTLENDVSVPDYSSAIAELNSKLENSDTNNERPNIEIKKSDKTNNFTFDEAVNYGIIRKLSYYTTTYTSTRSTVNRNHNIHLVSDILNNAIIKPNSEFSFLGTAGEMTEEDGFLAAGAMSNGEIVQSVAGGVCQVATTVFNAAYDAGLDITERHNHQMQISSYPTGLDAAVNVPDQDLTFINDTTSDVLLRAEYDDTSVTISLYGACTKRNIETTKTDPKTEKKYTTTYEETNQLSKDKWSIKTRGVNGVSMTATRTVTDEHGNVIHKDAFYSYYIPTNEVVLVGEGSDVSKIKQQRESESNKNE